MTLVKLKQLNLIMLGKLKFNNKGFTLVEVFVAITVLFVGVVGSFGVLPAMIKNQAMNSDVFLASQLANEGMELVRNLRDTNWLSGNAWDNGLMNCSLGCEIDYNDIVLVASGSRFLKIDSNNFYNYDSGKDSKFTRTIKVQKVGVLLNVKVEVSWSGKGSPFLVEGNLYDWR